MESVNSHSEKEDYKTQEEVDSSRIKMTETEFQYRKEIIRSYLITNNLETDFILVMNNINEDLEVKVFFFA